MLWLSAIWVTATNEDKDVLGFRISLHRLGSYFINGPFYSGYLFRLWSSHRLSDKGQREQKRDDVLNRHGDS